MNRTDRNNLLLAMLYAGYFAACVWLYCLVTAPLAAACCAAGALFGGTALGCAIIPYLGVAGRRYAVPGAVLATLTVLALPALLSDAPLGLGILWKTRQAGPSVAYALSILAFSAGVVLLAAAFVSGRRHSDPLLAAPVPWDAQAAWAAVSSWRRACLTCELGIVLGSGLVGLTYWTLCNLPSPFHGVYAWLGITNPVVVKGSLGFYLLAGLFAVTRLLPEWQRLGTIGAYGPTDLLVLPAQDRATLFWCKLMPLRSGAPPWLVDRLRGRMMEAQAFLSASRWGQLGEYLEAAIARGVLTGEVLMVAAACDPDRYPQIWPPESRGLPISLWRDAMDDVARAAVASLNRQLAPGSVPVSEGVAEAAPPPEPALRGADRLPPVRRLRRL